MKDLKKVTRFELINKYERQIVIYSKEHKNGNKNINKIEYDLQDNEQTLKVFIG